MNKIESSGIAVRYSYIVGYSTLETEGVLKKLKKPVDLIKKLGDKTQRTVSNAVGTCTLAELGGVKFLHIETDKADLNEEDLSLLYPEIDEIKKSENEKAKKRLIELLKIAAQVFVALAILWLATYFIDKIFSLDNNGQRIGLAEFTWAIIAVVATTIFIIFSAIGITHMVRNLRRGPVVYFRKKFINHMFALDNLVYFDITVFNKGGIKSLKKVDLNDKRVELMNEFRNLFESLKYEKVISNIHSCAIVNERYMVLTLIDSEKIDISRARQITFFEMNLETLDEFEKNENCLVIDMFSCESIDQTILS